MEQQSWMTTWKWLRHFGDKLNFGSDCVLSEVSLSLEFRSVIAEREYTIDKSTKKAKLYGSRKHIRLVFARLCKFSARKVK
jgi:hypothetical protein